MLKKEEEKVVDFQKAREDQRRPRGERTSTLGAELNEQLSGWGWLDKVRAAGL